MAKVTGSPFLFLANQTALDFINTEVIARGEQLSLIQNYADLKAWLLAANVVDAEGLQAAEQTWDAANKTAVVEQALTLRDRLREAAVQIVAGAPIAEHTLQAVNTLLRHPVGYVQVEATADGYVRRLHFDPQRPADLLAPIAEAAGDLLCGTDHTQIRKCENPTCILYFYDNSKNHARRWCSMSICGNRMKAAKHYRRTRASHA